jgi:hypothetical protein
VLCLALPAAVLAGAYLWLAVDLGEPALWHVIVHESGRYTLGETVLYVRHFLREIPTVIAMALFIVASYGAARGAGRDASASRWLGWAIAGLAGATGLTVASMAAVAAEYGPREAVQNLIQLYTRDDLPAFGSHWRFHLLSTLWFGLAAPVTAWMGARLAGGPPPARSSGTVIGRVAWLYFLGVTAVFGVGLEPVLDPRFIGHQAREILTHALTTLPVGLGVMAVVQRAAPVPAEDGGRGRPAVIQIAGLIAIPAYLGIAVVTADAMAAGQTDRGLSAMVAAHFFEHSLDYLLAALLVVGFQAGRVYRRAAQAARPSETNPHTASRNGL